MLIYIHRYRKFSEYFVRRKKKSVEDYVQYDFWDTYYMRNIVLRERNFYIFSCLSLLPENLQLHILYLFIILKLYFRTKTKIVF